MQGFCVRSFRATAVLVLIALGLVSVAGCSGHSDALWHIVSQQCVPAKIEHGTAGPCAEVDLQQGYAVLKDRRGPLQYLLLPTTRLTGMESPSLLDADSAGYMRDAWTARRWLSRRYGQLVPDRDIALAINSAHGRTQNQLHIHISCIKPDVRRTLDAENASIGSAWAPLASPLGGHRYMARRISSAALQRDNVFAILAEAPDARGHLGDYGLGLASLSGGDFALLATRYHWLNNHFTGAEEIQDHQCPQLDPAPIRQEGRKTAI